MLSTLESKLKMKVSDEHPIRSWISRHISHVAVEDWYRWKDSLRAENRKNLEQATHLVWRE
eukprot:4146119-Karenia_brevis.AAC.1